MIADAKMKPIQWANLIFVISLLVLGCQKKSENVQIHIPTPKSNPDSTEMAEHNPTVGSSDSTGSSSLSNASDASPSRMLNEDQQRELVGQLVALGLGSQASDSFFASISADSAQALEYSQSEAELDDKPGKETVSWWGFQSGSGDAIQRIYWLVISSNQNPAKAIAYHLITLPYCDASEQGTATIQLAPWKNQIQQVLLAKTLSLSCGAQISGAQQIDSLRFVSGLPVYREGQSSSLGETDKSEIPE